MIDLGRLEKVELRKFFKDEARDFTPWLAKGENLELLSDTLGIDIEQYRVNPNIQEKDLMPDFFC